MVYGISRFLTVVTEVKSEFMLERFGDSPKDSDFMRKYSESITVYHKFLILLQQPQSAHKESLSPIFVASEQGLDASA